MSNRLKELRTKRGTLVANMRAILEAAEKEKRDLTGEEQTNYDKVFAEQTSIGETIKREERQVELDREMAEAALRSKETPPADGEKPSEQRDASPTGSPEYRAAFGAFIRRGMNGLTPEQLRAVQIDPAPQGGYLVAPEAFVNDLIKAMDNMTFIRQAATKFQVPQAQSLGVPTLDADPADADWTSELGTGNEDSTMAFGKRKLTPHPLAKRIKVSNDMILRLPGVEGLVRSRLAYKFGISTEKGYLTGSGVNQPLGVFTASNDGVPTSRDIATDNTATAITGDGLINAKYALKTQYWNKATWMFHRDAMKQITKLKDQNLQYVWLASLRDGSPDTVLGRPVMTSEYVPNTFTSGLYVGALADWSQYWIADALDLQIQRLAELYAETNQVGFIGRLLTDGAPVLAEAFVRVKLTLSNTPRASYQPRRRICSAGAVEAIGLKFRFRSRRRSPGRVRRGCIFPLLIPRKGQPPMDLHNNILVRRS
jgi:HK97 family phage major capsid protein